MLSRISGGVPVAAGQRAVDIGLGLKFSRRSLYLPGYVRRVPHPRKADAFAWEYSTKAVELLQDFKTTFPDLFFGLEAAPEAKEYTVEQLFLEEDGTPIAGDATARLEELQAWLAALPTLQLPLCPCESSSFDTPTVRVIEQAARRLQGPTHSVSVPNLAPAVLIKPIAMPMQRPDPPQWQLGHRAANLRASGPVPLGMRGTVVALYDNRAEVVFDTPFLAGDNLGGRLHDFCGAVVPLWSILNLSAGELKVARADTAPKGSKKKKSGGGGGGAAAAGGGGKKKANMFDLLADASA